MNTGTLKHAALYPIFLPTAGGIVAGFIDRKGREVIKPTFTGANPFTGDLASVKESGKWGAINEGGELVVRPISDSPRRISERRCIFDSGMRRGVTNETKDVLVIPRYEANRSIQ